MKSIQINHEDGIKEVATNESGEGMFVRAENGTWKQYAGTAIFNAHTPKDLARKIRLEFEGYGSMVKGSAKGW